MSAKSGSLSILVTYSWDSENCPLYGVAGCLLFRSCLSIEVNGRAVGTLRIVRFIVGVRYSGVSVKWGSTVLPIVEGRLTDAACIPVVCVQSLLHNLAQVRLELVPAG